MDIENDIDSALNDLNLTKIKGFIDNFDEKFIFKYGDKLVHKICRYGNLDMIKYAFTKLNFENPNTQYTFPIHIICSNNTILVEGEQLEAIKFLVENNVDFRRVDYENMTPLHFVCSNKTNMSNKNQLGAIKYLVGKGVNLECVNIHKWRPIHFICSDINNLSSHYQLKAIK